MKDKITVNNNGRSENDNLPLSENFMEQLEGEIALTDGQWEEDEIFDGAVGRTMFDTPQSKDNTITVLLPRDSISLVPSQSLVVIHSRDDRKYIGMVVEGPFAEPDGLRADSPIVVTTTVRGTMFMPKYHGRVQVVIIAEEIDGRAIPPRFRPLPNSPVFALGEQETAERLGLLGNIALGLAIGYKNMPVSLPTNKKTVFPRHIGILGTTGGGKSTTTSGLIKRLSDNDVAVVLFDTEGEYTFIMEPTEDADMIAALGYRELPHSGCNAQNTRIYHLVGRETSNTEYEQNLPFSLKYSNLSPYAVMEILDFNDAQQQRFLKAYDIAKRILMQLRIYGAEKHEQAKIMELDEMNEGFPCLTLEMMYDVVRACAHVVDGAFVKDEDGELKYPYFQTKQFYSNKERVMSIINQVDLPSHIGSWRRVQGSLSTLLRLKIFDNSDADTPDYEWMTRKGNVTIIDLGDTDSSQVNNLVISELLRGVRVQQDKNYRASEDDVSEEMRKVLVVIEEAHEFLSSTRIKQMPVIFEQVASIARRGRKRWLGLMFVTQLPQHLPDEVLGLINNYILHKIGDAGVLSRLKRSVGGIEDSQWNRLTNLAPGQAIVKAESMTRSMLVAIDPTPCKLRMID